MYTQAYFEDIQPQIIREIKKAGTSICIAVAWFTDPELFELLKQKAASGVRVVLLIANDKINEKSAEDHACLRSAGGTVTMIGNRKSGKSMMHNKFCVIDAATIITGSFNWSRQAQQNDENITVISEAPELAQQFLAEFETIQQRQTGKDSTAGDFLKIISRMEALRIAINLEDDDDISLQATKLKRLLSNEEDFTSEQQIINLIEDEQFPEALSMIDEYCRIRKQVAAYVDPEIGRLKLELKSLEIQIAAVEDEKAEVEKLLHAFNYRHTIELGSLLRKILKLRVERLKVEARDNPEKVEEYQEANKDYKEFVSDCDEAEQNPVAELSAEEEQELKSLFRACTKLCHPDIVADKDKAAATQLFQQLNEANERNDITAIRMIYENLKKGIFAFSSTVISDVEILTQHVASMYERLANLARTVQTMKRSETYRIVSTLGDLNEYFASAKEQLQKELLALKNTNE